MGQLKVIVYRQPTGSNGILVKLQTRICIYLNKIINIDTHIRNTNIFINKCSYMISHIGVPPIIIYVIL